MLTGDTGAPGRRPKRKRQSRLQSRGKGSHPSRSQVRGCTAVCKVATRRWKRKGATRTPMPRGGLLPSEVAQSQWMDINDVLGKRR